MRPAPARGVEIRKRLFTTLMSELARRGNGMHESGAFLLGTAAPETGSPEDTRQVVEAIAFYDDLDPGCLTGNISFTADGYTALATLCRRKHLRVIADIHTHPGPWVSQSQVDAAHPMVALPGHVALIAPHYAQGVADARELGVHVYQGNRQWTSYFGSDTLAVLRITRSPALSAALLCARRWARRLTRRFRHLLSTTEAR